MGISVDEEQARLTKMVAQNAMDWPQVWDGPDFSGPIAKKYSVDGTPLIYLIDRAGRIAGRFRSIKLVERELSEVLAAPARSPARNARDAWQRPYAVMEKLGIAEGSHVADVGSGEGYFTLRLAVRVGEKGKVYAVDLDDAALGKLREAASSEGFPQVATIRGEPNNPNLPAAMLDAVLVVDAYHEFRDYDAMLRAIAASLRPGGQLGVLDTPDALGRSRGDYHQRHRIPAELLIEEAGRAGLRLKYFEAEFTQNSDTKNYLAVFEKPVN